MKKDITQYAKYLELKVQMYEEIYLELEKYIEFFGKTYPNGRQILVPYKCIDNIKEILKRDYIEL